MSRYHDNTIRSQYIVLALAKVYLDDVVLWRFNVEATEQGLNDCYAPLAKALGCTIRAYDQTGLVGLWPSFPGRPCGTGVQPEVSTEELRKATPDWEWSAK